MKANAYALLTVFQSKTRLEVPLFQRQYVWDQERQWEPLWEDVERKFQEFLTGRKDAPIHFLGAMVLDQKQTPAGHVDRRQIIDGQQRLTTLQIFLAAFRDYCRACECEDLAREVEGFTENKGMMTDATVDRFKIWPTQLDRAQFVDVLTAKSREELEKLHPLKKRKYKRHWDPRPRMVEAYLFFYDSVSAFFEGTEEQAALAEDVPIASRLEECFQALKNALHIVAIDLEPGDDAQMIFETLNARGQSLLPADLLKNFIFLRASRNNEPTETLYQKYWQTFDDEFWREEVSQGRLTRPRSDLFMQHFLSSHWEVEVSVKHLFVEYKTWIEREKPFKTVEAELEALSRQGRDFRCIVAPEKDDSLYSFMDFLERFEIRTCYPLLLFFFDVRLSEKDWLVVARILESYLLRRAVCGMSTNNYNRIFVQLTKTMRRTGFSAAKLRESLLEFHGASTEWPDDETFAHAWRTQPVYQTLNNRKQVHIFRRLNDAYLTPKQERIVIEGELAVEHLMPQKWQTFWPLPDGSRGLSEAELEMLPHDDVRAAATRLRDSLVQTFGNLTVIPQPLNLDVSHRPWKVKKPKLKVALLPVTLALQEYQTWDETTIRERSNALFKKARMIWPR